MKEKLEIKETIVCEGKNDVQAIKQGVEANFIITSGFGISKDILKQIQKAQDTTGVIVLTDPDFMGERIREILNKKVPGIKNAFISRSEGRDRGDIGVENASPESIIRALKKARCVKPENEGHKEDSEITEEKASFDTADIYFYGLTGVKGSDERRERVAEILGLGYCNSKQLVHRMNVYGILREELESAVHMAEKEEQEKENGKG